MHTATWTSTVAFSQRDIHEHEKPACIDQQSIAETVRWQPALIMYHRPDQAGETYRRRTSLRPADVELFQCICITSSVLYTAE